MGKLLLVMTAVLAVLCLSLVRSDLVPLAGRGRELVYREPGWRVPEAGSSRWQCIVIHHSATDIGGAARFDRAHRQKWDELGYHFVIGNGTDTDDGEVEVGPRWPKQKHGAHCKTADNFYNDHGIAICLVGDFERRKPTPKQLKSLARLVAFLAREHGIPLSRVMTHGQITGRTKCPGKNFSLKDVLAMVESL